MQQLELPDVSRLAGEVLDEVEVAVVGKREALTLVLAAILAGGHVLLEDFPGLGKTLAARSFAQTLGLDFTRAQFTPDLLPSDLTGAFVYDQRSGEFSFRRGPLFTGLLLADEINRTPPRTQSALLEAMQERQITVEGQTFLLERPFHVLATANPIEYEGTYPLPEAQLDRFMMRTSFGYPSAGDEWDVLQRRMERQREEQSLRQVTDAPTLVAMQEAVERVTVDESVGRYCVALATATRSHQHVLMGSSPRGSLGLLLASRAFAVIDGRDYVTPEDVKAVAEPVLAHRITVKPEMWLSQVSGRTVVEAVLATVPAPAPLESMAGGGAGAAVTSGVDHWRPTFAYVRAAAGAFTLIACALIWRRPDLLVIATPFAIVTAWSVLTRPHSAPSFEEGIGHATLREGDATTWRGAVSGAEHLDFAVAALDDAPWFESEPASGVVTARAVDGVADLEIDVRSTRWGLRYLERVRVSAVGPWGAFRWTTTTKPHQLTTLPLPPLFDVDAAARPSDGLIGLHRSARAGEGNEFAAIRPFRAGDRLRRINWTRSARSNELQVNATWADLDTHIALVVDATDDFGVSEGIDGLASSLDGAVRAAGAIAEHYAPRGERVSLRTIGAPTASSVRPATGRAQLRRILEMLARVRVPNRGWTGTRAPVGAQRPAAGGQITVVLSPLIAPEVIDLVVSLGRQGTGVIVVDTLPNHVTEDEDEFTALAWRIRLLERRRELRMVQAAGIPVVRWRGPGSLDQVIRDIGRRATGPRILQR